MFLRRFSTNIIREISPYSKIKIDGRLNYKIKPFDLFECQESNKLRASFENPDKSIESILQINVKNDHVELKDFATESEKDLCCFLEVPIKADLSIKTDQNVSLSDLYCEHLDIEAKNIQTKNIHGTEIKMSTNGGKISSNGLLLGKQIRLFLEKGDLSLDRVQGEKFFVKQSDGTVKISSCYSSFSQFDCTDSHLNLKNIHKLCHIHGHGTGELILHGFSGTLIADLENYLLNLQFSELLGRNKVTCKSDKPSKVNLAPQILEDCYVKIRAIKMTLDEELTSLNLSTNGDHIKINDKSFENHLRIEHTHEVRLGKLDWADAFNFGAIGKGLNIKSKEI